MLVFPEILSEEEVAELNLLTKPVEKYFMEQGKIIGQWIHLKFWRYASMHLRTCTLTDNLSTLDLFWKQ